jgi:hypothetical protein
VSGTSVQLRVVGKLPLRCWGLNDLESQMGGPPLEVVNLPLAVSILSVTTEHFCCLIHRAVSAQGRFLQFAA